MRPPKVDGQRQFRQGDRVRTPTGLLGTVLGYAADRVSVRYDSRPEWQLLGREGGRVTQEAVEVCLPEGLLRRVWRK